MNEYGAEWNDRKRAAVVSTDFFSRSSGECKGDGTDDDRRRAREPRDSQNSNINVDERHPRRKPAGFAGGDASPFVSLRQSLRGEQTGNVIYRTERHDFSRKKTNEKTRLTNSSNDS